MLKKSKNTVINSHKKNRGQLGEVGKEGKTYSAIPDPVFDSFSTSFRDPIITDFAIFVKTYMIKGR